MSPSATLPSFEEIASLPKIELHAHLFGSIRVPVLEKIRQTAAEEQKQTTESCYGANADEAAASVARIEGKCIGIGDAFAYFSAVYQIVRRKDDIVYALRRVLEDFSRDNVVYLELRTTLKTIPEDGVDPDNYVALLVEELKSAEKQHPMIVRLILSLNRSRLTNEVETREETVKILDLAAKYPEWIVGVDIAGDPRKGNILPALEVLEKEVMNPNGAHHGKLKVTVHTSEVEGSEKETKAVLKLAPHRIGHGCYLAADQREYLLKEKICVEICPSSNMCTLNLRDLRDHPFSYYYGKKVLYNAVCICTDDIGLFDTSLSKELHVLSQAYKLSLSDVLDLQRSALAAAFCRDEDKAKIEEKFFRPLM